MSFLSSRSIIKSNIIIDRFGRQINYLRLSVIDRCNLSCLYCIPSKGIIRLTHSEVLTLEELLRISKIAVSLGIDKIRLTGGEPLLRHNLYILLKELNRLIPRPEIRLTTNGLLLSDNLDLLLSYGISTINISLDTLKPERYGYITGLPLKDGVRAFSRIWRGLKVALANDKLIIKLNVVVMAGINDDEVCSFANLTRSYPLTVRFIEYMPIGRETLYIPYRYLSVDEIWDRLGRLGKINPLPRRISDGPAQRFILSNAMGEIGIISTISDHFCAFCNRVRFSSDGYLMSCLFSEPKLNLRSLLRSGYSDKNLAQIINQVIIAKPKCHTLPFKSCYSTGYQMSRLGG